MAKGERLREYGALGGERIEICSVRGADDFRIAVVFLHDDDNMGYGGKGSVGLRSMHAARARTTAGQNQS